MNSTISGERYKELSKAEIDVLVSQFMELDDKEPTAREFIERITELKRDREAFATAIEEIIRRCYAELFFVDSDPAWDLYKEIQRGVAEELNKPQQQLIDDIWKETLAHNRKLIDTEEQRNRLLKRIVLLEDRLRAAGIELPEEE